MSTASMDIVLLRACKVGLGYGRTLVRGARRGDHRRHAAFNEFSFESGNSRGDLGTVSFDCKIDGASVERV